MTDHWKDVQTFDVLTHEDMSVEHIYRKPTDQFRGDYMWAHEVIAARAKDSEAHAAALAAKDAEIATLRAQVQEDAHLRSIVDLYRADPLAMADALWRMRDELGRLKAPTD